MTCKNRKCCGPGYASPAEAMKAPKEKVLFVTCPHADGSGNDMLAAIDVDPDSETFCQVRSCPKLYFHTMVMKYTIAGGMLARRAMTNRQRDVISKHFRTHIILPCLNSDRIYIVNVEDEKNIRIDKVRGSKRLFQTFFADYRFSQIYIFAYKKDAYS
ncbi:unnamed protein product [Cylicostephanus goldi]|uniref:Uncharacterized protein n=1 Tax=Cylicostephanus goldi TaxID=71465 RepID=A0A3P7MRQ1_CYLGO|nr:unnamed protein product [Cylicostephanus goldi]